MRIFLLACSLFIFLSAQAKELDTNTCHFMNAPEWLRPSRVDRVSDKIESFLEWDIRKVKVSFYLDEKSFESFHHMGGTVVAVSRKSDSNVFLGPKVTDKNFDIVFGHELVHVVLGQKYKDAIPAWLEEGLANYLVKSGPVDYKKVQSFIKEHGDSLDVHKLSHPYKDSPLPSDLHYMASRALVEMIAKKCDLLNLLQMSVGKNLESYLGTLCEIENVNTAFKDYLKRQAR